MYVVDKTIGDTDLNKLSYVNRKLEFKDERKMPYCTKYDFEPVQIESNISSSMITVDGGLLIVKYDQIKDREQFCVDRDPNGEFVAVFCDGCHGKVDVNFIDNYLI